MAPQSRKNTTTLYRWSGDTTSNSTWLVHIGDRNHIKTTIGKTTIRRATLKRTLTAFLEINENTTHHWVKLIFGLFGQYKATWGVESRVLGCVCGTPAMYKQTALDPSFHIPKQHSTLPLLCATATTATTAVGKRTLSSQFNA